MGALVRVGVLGPPVAFLVAGAVLGLVVWPVSFIARVVVRVLSEAPVVVGLVGEHERLLKVFIC